LTESDVRTLRRALNGIKAARRAAKGDDRGQAAKASALLADLLCYVAGYLDARSAGISLNAGFQSVFQSSLVTMADPEAQLDEFEKSLEAALQPGGTRYWNIVAGAALIAIGIALKQV
jgi:hypothetical protein